MTREESPFNLTDLKDFELISNARASSAWAELLEAKFPKLAALLLAAQGALLGEGYRRQMGAEPVEIIVRLRGMSDIVTAELDLFREWLTGTCDQAAMKAGRNLPFFETLKTAVTAELARRQRDCN